MLYACPVAEDATLRTESVSTTANSHGLETMMGISMERTIWANVLPYYIAPSGAIEGKLRAKETYYKGDS